MITIKNKRLRTLLRWGIPFIAIPVLTLSGAEIFGEKRHLLVSFGVAALALLLFAAGYERKPVGSRRMVLAAVLVALCVAGRFIPFFKPITALTVLGAIYLGGETGFLIGALSALISDFYFGQGPWTPFQMLAWGLIGLFAGMLAKPLKMHRALLLAYGILAGAAYSLVMDVWTVMWYDGSFRMDLYLTALMTSVPHTILYSASNFIFLWFMAKPLGEKLERIKLKYGV